jgi:hypothetical protein
MCSPDATQANKRGPRTLDSAFLADLAEYVRSLNKVFVVTEGYKNIWFGWGL